MNKKILSIIACIILVAIVLPASSTKIENQTIENSNFDKLDFDNDLLDNYPVMDIPLDLIEPDKISPKPIPKSSPNEFNWADYNGNDWTTPARNQKNCGSCWAFAALGALESVIKIEEDCPDFYPDLSEQYLMSCLPESGSCRGGSSHEAFRLIKDTGALGNYNNGVIFEDCLPYEADDDIPCSAKCEEWENQLVPLLDYSSWRADGSESDREAIKTQIMDEGPVVAHVKATDNFQIWGALNHDPEAYYRNYLGVVGINHVIIIIGWKDSSTIPKGGYWICKNSWGTNWGYDGFFNLVYGSLNIEKYWIISPDYDPDSFDWDPVVDTGGSYGGFLNEEVTFDASGSVGVEGEIVDYSWNFGDDSNGSGEITTHTYTELGKHTVTLTITDSENNGATDTTFIWIQESNDPPNKPIIEGTANGGVGKIYEYTFSSLDSDGNDVWYLIDWGDSTNTGWIGPFESEEEVSLKKSWNAKGSYTITVKAKDVFDEESEIATLPISMPIKKASLRFTFLTFIEKILNTFSFLQYIW